MYRWFVDMHVKMLKRSYNTESHYNNVLLQAIIIEIHVTPYKYDRDSVCIKLNAHYSDVRTIYARR